MKHLDNTVLDADIETSFLTLGPHPKALQLVWFFLLTAGQAGLLLILGTVLASKTLGTRHQALVNLLFIIFLTTISYSLLFYTQQYMNPSPPPMLCLVQAATKHGLDPAFVTAMFLHVFESLLSVRTCLYGRALLPKLRIFIVISFPWVNLVAWSTTALVVGIQNQGAIIRVEHSFYCTLQNTGTVNTVKTYQLAVLGSGTVVLQVYLFLFIWKKWAAIRQQQETTVQTSIIFRVFVIVIFESIILALNLPSGNPILQASISAAVPFLAFLVFATQQDILKVWMGWTRTIREWIFGSRRRNIRDEESSVGDSDDVEPDQLSVEVGGRDRMTSPQWSGSRARGYSTAVVVPSTSTMSGTIPILLNIQSIQSTEVVGVLPEFLSPHASPWTARSHRFQECH